MCFQRRVCHSLTNRSRSPTSVNFEKGPVFSCKTQALPLHKINHWIKNHNLLLHNKVKLIKLESDRWWDPGDILNEHITWHYLFYGYLVHQQMYQGKCKHWPCCSFEVNLDLIVWFHFNLPSKASQPHGDPVFIMFFLLLGWKHFTVDEMKTTKKKDVPSKKCVRMIH